MNNKLISFRQTGQPTMIKDADGSVTISIPIAIKRRSGRTIVRSPACVTANPNRVGQDITPLQLALIRGYRWLRMLEEGKAKSLKEVAEKEKVDSSYVSRIVNLTLLAPDIIAVILDDQLPERVSLFDLAVDVPVGWAEQRLRIDYGWSGRTSSRATNRHLDLSMVGCRPAGDVPLTVASNGRAAQDGRILPFGSIEQGVISFPRFLQHRGSRYIAILDCSIVAPGEEVPGLISGQPSAGVTRRGSRRECPRGGSRKADLFPREDGWCGKGQIENPASDDGDPLPSLAILLRRLALPSPMILIPRRPHETPRAPFSRRAQS